jgi:hypothetical protein
MPKLPRSPLADVSPVQNRRVVNQENRVNGADPVAQQMTATGNAAFEATSRIREAHITAEVANAQNDLRLRLDGEYRALQNDNGDPAELESKFAARAKEVLGETSKGMSSPMHKRLFEAQSAELTDTYTIKTRDLTRQKQLDGARALAMRTLDGVTEAASDPTIPREVLEKNADNSLATFREQFRIGAINAEQLADAEIKTDTAVKAGVSLRHISNVDAMMDAGRYGEAEEYFKANYSEVAPAQREKVESAIEMQGREAKAIGKADDFWGASDGDYDKAILKARAITDPKERLAVEERLATLKAQDTAADNATQERVKEELLDHVLSGGGMSNAPQAALREADAFTRDFIEGEIYSRRERAQRMATLSAQERAALKEASAISKDFIAGYAALAPESYMAGPAEWKASAPELYSEWQNMTDANKQDIVTDIAKRKASGGTFNEADKVFKDLIAQVPILGPENMKGSDFDKGSKGKGTKRKPTDEEKAVRGSLLRQAQEHATRTGGAPITIEQSKVMIARAFREYSPKRYPFEEPGAFVDPLISAVMQSPVGQETYEYLKEKYQREPTLQEMRAGLQMAGALE